MKYYALMVIAAITLPTASVAEDNVTLTGEQLVAFRIALSDFDQFEYPLEKYTVEISSNDGNIEIVFVPTADIPPGLRGNPDYGMEVRYVVSVSADTIVDRSFGR